MLQHQVIKSFPQETLQVLCLRSALPQALPLSPQNVEIEKNMKEHQVIRSFFVEIHQICDLCSKLILAPFTQTLIVFF